MKLQRLGGYSAFGGVCASIARGLFNIIVIQKHAGNFDNPSKVITAVLSAPIDFYVFNLLAIIALLLFLVMLFALYERMHADAPYLTSAMLIASSAGTLLGIVISMIDIRYIRMVPQTQKVSLYYAMDLMHNGLGMAMGHTFAWAWLFTGCAILRTRAFSRIPGGLFLLAGLLELPSFIVSQLDGISILLGGVGSVGIGIALLRGKQPQPQSI